VCKIDLNSEVRQQSGIRLTYARMNGRIPKVGLELWLDSYDLFAYEELNVGSVCPGQPARPDSLR
jgi:hypothetical protein